MVVLYCGSEAFSKRGCGHKRKKGVEGGGVNTVEVPCAEKVSRENSGRERVSQT